MAFLTELWHQEGMMLVRRREFVVEVETFGSLSILREGFAKNGLVPKSQKGRDLAAVPGGLITPRLAVRGLPSTTWKEMQDGKNMTRRYLT